MGLAGHGEGGLVTLRKVSAVRRYLVLASLAAATAGGCKLDTRGVPFDEGGDGGGEPDAAADSPDSAGPDGAAIDAAAIDAAALDAAMTDAMPVDAMPIDAMPVDAMPVDAMPIDAMPVDAMPVDAMPVTCPAGYVASGNAAVTSRHRFVDSNTSRANAAADCANDLVGKTFLAIVDSAAENAVLDARAGNRAVWLGMSDRATEGTWITDLGGTQAYFNWASNQPDDFFEEDCAEALDGGTWNDIDCSNQSRRYVCECDVTLP